MKPSDEINIIENQIMPNFQREMSTDDEKISAKIEAVIIYLDKRYEAKHRLKRRKN